VLKLRSTNNIVIPPAKTGNDNNNKIVVINNAQTKRGKRSIRIPRARIFQIVEIKLTEPASDDAPAK